MNPDEIADWKIDYDLSEKLEFIGGINDSESIKFKTSGNCITGFVLRIKDSTIKDAEIKGGNKAKNLKNFLTIKSGQPMEVNLKSLQSIPKPGEDTHIQGTFTITTGGIGGAVKNIDISEPNIQTIINSQAPDNLKYEFVSKGIFYYYNGDPIDCIKELFRAVEDRKNFPNYDKYNVIRDIYSHKLPYRKKTTDLFKVTFNPNTFEGKFDPDNGIIILDSTSNKKTRLLYKMAKEFRSDVKKLLKLD